MLGPAATAPPKPPPSPGATTTTTTTTITTTTTSPRPRPPPPLFFHQTQDAAKVAAQLAEAQDTASRAQQRLEATLERLRKDEREREEDQGEGAIVAARLKQVMRTVRVAGCAGYQHKCASCASASAS